MYASSAARSASALRATTSRGALTPVALFTYSSNSRACFFVNFPCDSRCFKQFDHCALMLVDQTIRYDGAQVNSVLPLGHVAREVGALGKAFFGDEPLGVLVQTLDQTLGLELPARRGSLGGPAHRGAAGLRRAELWLLARVRIKNRGIIVADVLDARLIGSRVHGWLARHIGNGAAALGVADPFAIGHAGRSRGGAFHSGDLLLELVQCPRFVVLLRLELGACFHFLAHYGGGFARLGFLSNAGGQVIDVKVLGHQP